MLPKETEEALMKENQWLKSLPEEDRVEYVNNVIESLAESLKQITETEGTAQKLRQLGKLRKEIQDKGAILVPPIVYAIKPEFQGTFREFIIYMLFGWI